MSITHDMKFSCILDLVTTVNYTTMETLGLGTSIINIVYPRVHELAYICMCSITAEVNYQLNSGVLFEGAEAEILYVRRKCGCAV